MENKSYVYRHRRLDTNEIFYIGIGRSKNFRRAFTTQSRSIFWKNITSKTDYSVEIIKEDISWKEACELECLLISEYGRKDLGTGTLVNLTDGGDGHGNPSKKEMERRKEFWKGVTGEHHPMYGHSHSEESKSKMRGKRPQINGKNHPQYGKKREFLSEINRKRKGKNHPCYGKPSKLGKLVINLETGIFYDSIKKAAESCEIGYQSLKYKLNGTYKNNTKFKVV